MRTKFGKHALPPWLDRNRSTITESLRASGLNSGLIESAITLARTLNDKNGHPNPRNTISIIERAVDEGRDVELLLRALKSTEQGLNPYKTAKKSFEDQHF
ncbi:hypothetical protein HYT84_04605 [Candidatus Micrarchaeota archaeon]|nr:hypothetical protein [Candidatus Micrarchaeota archaeon]